MQWVARSVAGGSTAPSFADETASDLPALFVLPDSFRLLFDWIERNGWVWDSGGRDAARKRLGPLSDRDDNCGSLDVYFRVEGLSLRLDWSPGGINQGRS